MRSVWYRLTHRPRNLDDCLDLAYKVPISEVRLDLRYHDPVREQYPITQFLAQFEVKQGDNVRTVEKVCGVYLHGDSDEKKLCEVNRANTILRQQLSILSDHGVVLVNSNQEFEYHPPARNKPSVRHNPYERFANNEFILRDQLAIDRTVLANERTFLAYCRTALAIILTGAVCIKVFESDLSDIAGWILMALGLLIIAVGIKRTIRIARSIRTAQRQPGGPHPQHSQSSQQKEEPNRVKGSD